MEDPPPTPPTKYRLKPQENFVRANHLDPESLQSADHDVFAWRQDGREIEQKGGLDEVTIVARSNRRASDYWIVLIFVDIILALVGAWGRQNLFILVGCGAGIVLFTVGLTWIMWGITRRY